MSEEPPLSDQQWMTFDQVSAAWPTIRKECLEAVAKANGVRTSSHGSTSTWGARTWAFYHPDDVLRVARAITDGTAEITAEQRLDTPEGQAATATNARAGNRNCLVVIIAFLIVVVLVVLAALHSEGGPPSYWH